MCTHTPAGMGWDRVGYSPSPLRKHAPGARMHTTQNTKTQPKKHSLMQVRMHARVACAGAHAHENRHSCIAKMLRHAGRCNGKPPA